MTDIKLNDNQQAVANQIITYGQQNGYSQADIANAVKTAFIESSLGEQRAVAPPDTASGIFGYNNPTWNDSHHVGAGDKNNDADAIRAYFHDTDRYRERYNNAEQSVRDSVNQ